MCDEFGRLPRPKAQLGELGSSVSASVGAWIHSLVAQELLPYRGEKEGRVQTNGPTVTLEPYTAQAVAIALHELATNAAKYGSLSAADGPVEITWTRTTDGRLGLRWIWADGGGIAGWSESDVAGLPVSFQGPTQKTPACETPTRQ
jgi:two-component sensor histidine kinase